MPIRVDFSALALFLAYTFTVGTATAGTPVAGTAAADQRGPSAPDMSPETPVAVIGKTRVSYSELLSAANQKLAQKEAEHDTRVRQLQITYERARHEVLDSQMKALVNQRVLDLEAQSKKTTPERLLASLPEPTVSDTEVRQFYEQHEDQVQESFEKLQARIRDYLLEGKSKTANEGYYAGLRAKYAAEVVLEPLRASVASQGPSRGSEDAPVTIVEFADFQCPYCRKLEPVLAEALKRNPDGVRLVYRHYPLIDIHPQAMQAAQAAACADRQGRFWDMHDALFSPGAELTVESLRATAAHIGLDSQKFEECVRGLQGDGVIQQDMLEATALAVDGTPAMFVNGRFVSGAVSLETLTSLIDDELRRKKSSLVSAAATASAR